MGNQPITLIIYSLYITQQTSTIQLPYKFYNTVQTDKE